MSEARANRLKNQTGTASALINPLPVKRGNKDYMKENLAKLREATAANVAKKTVAEPVKDLFKLDKFKDVQSVVFQNVDFTVPAAKVCIVWASPACVVLQVWRSPHCVGNGPKVPFFVAVHVSHVIRHGLVCA
jgi:hypothetical protein